MYSLNTSCANSLSCIVQQLVNRSRFTSSKKTGQLKYCFRTKDPHFTAGTFYPSKLSQQYGTNTGKQLNSKPTIIFVYMLILQHRLKGSNTLFRAFYNKLTRICRIFVSPHAVFVSSISISLLSVNKYRVELSNSLKTCQRS